VAADTGQSGSGAVGATGTTPPVSAETPLLWASAILAAMGWPQTKSNIDAMVAWEQAEGGAWDNTASYNPLNTTQTESGSTSANSVGVQAYTSWAQGLAATVATLNQNQRGYSAIRAAFASGNASSTLPAALSSSAWGTNGGTVANLLSSQGYVQYESQTGAAGNTGSSGSAASSTCAFGIGPLCIFSEAGLQKFYGALLMGAGGLILLVGGGLVVVGALAETRAGRAVSKAAGDTGVGRVVGAAGAPVRAVQGSRQRGRARTAQATETARRESNRTAGETHTRAVRRAQLRTSRARARDAEARARVGPAPRAARTRTVVRTRNPTGGGLPSRMREERRPVQNRAKYDAVFGD
jgi:hypothetical protein